MINFFENIFFISVDYIESLSPFFQSILGAFVFTLTSWMAHSLYKRAKKTGKIFLKDYMRSDIAKHIMHKEYVRSSDINISSHGAIYVLLLASRYWLSGCLVLILFFGVSSITKGDWLYVVASWFAFNLFFEAYNWVKDSSDEKNISYVSEEVKQKIYKVHGKDMNLEERPKND